MVGRTSNRSGWLRHKVPVEERYLSREDLEGQGGKTESQANISAGDWAGSRRRLKHYYRG